MRTKPTFEEITSVLIQENDRRVYKVSVSKWKKGVKNICGGNYISIERHDSRPNSLKKDEMAWFRSQIISFKDYNTIDQLIPILQECSKFLKALNQEKETEKDTDIDEDNKEENKN